ncbi:MAG: DUF4352 domain-containing protein [Nanoarchaeota archaeon]
MSKNKSKPWYKKVWVWIAIVLVLGFFGSLGNNDGNSDPSSNTNSQGDVLNDGAQQESQPSEPEVFSLDEPIRAGSFEWTIKGYTTRRQIGEYIGDTLMGSEADGIYYVLDVEVENLDDTAEYLSDSFIKLVDGQGREFSADTGAAMFLEDNSYILFDQINPGIVKKGKIVFDAPENLEVVNLKISSSFMENSFYTVKLMT